MSVEIVTLSPDDWAAYRALRLEALQTEPQAFATPYDRMTGNPEAYWRGRLEEASQADKSWLLFAREDGKLPGMIGAFRLEEPETAEIISVYVTPSARGRGISKLLMAAILEKLAQGGIRSVVLGVVVEQAAAIGLYERFGFARVGSHRLALGDGLEHEIIEMEKGL